MKFYASKSNIFIYLYFIYAFAFLTIWGIDAFEQRIDFDFYADTDTYMEYAYYDYSISYLISNFPNLIGPLSILKLLGSNYYLVFALNISILMYFVYTVKKYYSLNHLYFVLLMVLSPMIFVSLIGINKEIISVFILSLLIRYEFSKNGFYIFFAFIASFLVRWQLAIFVLAIYFYFNFLVNYSNKKKLIFTLLVFSAMYFLNKSRFYEVNQVAEEGSDTNEGSGIYTALINIQNSNPLGYFMVFIPKFIFLYISKISKYSLLFDREDFHNNTIVLLQSALNAVTLVWVFLKNKWAVNNYLIISMLIYAIVFTLTPVYSPRYLFPVFIYSLIFIANKREENHV